MTRMMMLVGVFLAACKPATEEKPAPGPTVLAANDTVEVRRDTLTLGPRVAGTLEAGQMAVIRAEIGGSISRLSAEVGQTVTRGQVLASIDNSGPASAVLSARSAIAAAEQQLAVGEHELSRVERLKAAGALAERDVELARAQVRAVQAQLDGAKAQLAMAQEQSDATTIRAPIAGVVSVRSVGAGDVVNPGTPLFTVIDPTSLRLEGTVPAEQVSQLSRGARVSFEVRGFESQKIEGELSQIAPALDPATRQVRVIITIPNPDGALLAGVFAEGRVSAQARETLLLPDDAIRRVAGQTEVLRVKGDAVELVSVQLGEHDPQTEEVEILGGVEAGDVVVLAALPLDPGTKVSLNGGGAHVDQ